MDSKIDDIIDDKNSNNNSGNAITVEPIKAVHTDQLVTNQSTQNIESDPWYCCCLFCLDVCNSWSRATLSAHNTQQLHSNSCAQREEIDIGYNTKSTLDHWFTLFIGFFVGETESSHSDDESDNKIDSNGGDDESDDKSDDEHEDEYEIQALV